MLTGITPDILHKKLVETLGFFMKSAMKDKAVVGLSGGIDSAVVASVAVDALGPSSVTAILLPSPFSTLHSVSDAVELAENLKIQYYTVPIDGIFHKFHRELTDLFGEEPCRLTTENLQARIRATILMAFSNQTEALLLNTSNKSELSMGYGTLYGDLCGAIMVLGDIYKSDVYELADYLNSLDKRIPDSIITKEPSAELSVGQKDSDSLPPYPVLDPILYLLNEKGMSPQEIINSGAESTIVNKIVKMKDSASFKIAQLPPVIQIGQHPLLPDSKCIKL